MRLFFLLRDDLFAFVETAMRADAMGDCVFLAVRTLDDIGFCNPVMRAAQSLHPSTDFSFWSSHFSLLYFISASRGGITDFRGSGAAPR